MYEYEIWDTETTCGQRPDQCVGVEPGKNLHGLFKDFNLVEKAFILSEYLASELFGGGDFSGMKQAFFCLFNS